MKILKIIFLLLLLVVVSWMVTFFIGFYKSKQPIATNSPAAELEKVYGGLINIYNKSNPKIVEALDTADKGNFKESAILLEEARKSAQTSEEDAHLLYLEARSVEQYDRFQAIDMFKEVVANPNYPDRQKTYAALRLPFQFTASSDRTVLEKILSTEPYKSMRADSIDETIKNLYAYSLTFGDNGVGNFVVARWYAKLAYQGKNLAATEKDKNLELAITNFNAGERELLKSKELSATIDFDSALLPMTYRERGRANALIGIAGGEEAIKNFEVVFKDALANTLKSKVDGAVRFDYFVYSYLLLGKASFSKTQSTVNVLFDRITEYQSMNELFKSEKDNLYGSKKLFVRIANENEVFKEFLLKKESWVSSDFIN